ncbi:MAG: Phosphate metabolism transcription protein [Cirrosporium novae-zelandiae]|nr:MAG: Phosphate metabolism transcription protein [Cirrosporium novae-zelandiae]
MRFGKTLERSIYQPWKDHYIDYTKLKKLLRENDFQNSPRFEHLDGFREWTQEEEETFVDELINVQLEKVNAFQAATSLELRDRTSQCEFLLEPLAAALNKENLSSDGENSRPQALSSSQDMDSETTQAILKEVLKKLDEITKETNELERYSRINFTGFFKAAKKHDRRKGSKCKVKPLLQVRLAALPFNSEDYSPLLYRLSAMYSFVREHLDGQSGTEDSPFSDDAGQHEPYHAYKFWVHIDNVLEVKTSILRHLPVLVYNPQASKDDDRTQMDPTITSVYFDSPVFELYENKVSRKPNASSLRLRWYGHLNDKPEVIIEKKTICEKDKSTEVKFPIKEKYILPFLRGEYHMEKSIQKLQDREGPDSASLNRLKKNVEEIQTFIDTKKLQPMLRANYTRTAFQFPGDDRIRIAMDTNLALIREDALDSDRPCRDPDDWHRTDIDDQEMEYPFTTIKKGEITRFPYALLEIKIKDGKQNEPIEWVSDLMSSHLLKDSPRFSKFVTGVAQLFDDYVNSFPFWLSELDTDIRKDPEIAFEEEKERIAKRAEDEVAVGSFIGSKSSPAFRPAIGSPARQQAYLSSSVPRRNAGVLSIANVVEEDDNHQGRVDEGSDDDLDVDHEFPQNDSNLVSMIPRFSSSKYARAHQQRSVKLPPGVQEPKYWSKNAGPVKVEGKVWLANQRTFIKWQHISVLLASLSLGLYNAAGANNKVAGSLAIVYTMIALFAGAWGWWTYVVRSRLIRERSGKDFDYVLGPIVVCISLIIALCLNFAFKFKAAVSINVSIKLADTFSQSWDELMGLCNV